MLPARFVGLLVILLAVQGWCKPAKNDDADDYNDDDPPSDYNDDDTIDDDDDPETFEEPPQILSKPESVHVRTGSTIKLPCLVKNTDNFAVTWSKDNEYLYYDSSSMTPDNKRIIRLPDNTLVIYNATVNDSSSSYECSILSQPPIMIKHRVLVDSERAPPPPPTTQTPKPLIRITPGNKIEISAGESLTLTCQTRIEPTPEIKWFHENKRISGTPISDGSRVTIPNVSRHEGGRYQCLIEDGSVSPPFDAITVVVNYAPEIEAKNQIVHSGLGVESDLTCIVHAHPHAKVKWYKGQKEITPEKGKIELKGNKTWNTLQIMHTTQQDFGWYSCVATNRMGRAEKKITLTGAPSQAVIYGSEVARTDTGLILKWRLESYSPVTEYKLEYRLKGDEFWTVIKPTVTNGKGNQFYVEQLIEGLQPGSYEAILTARNNFGWSQPSEPHSFTGEVGMENTQEVTGSAAALRPLGAAITLFLVLSSCAFRSL